MKYVKSSITDKRGFEEYVYRLDSDLYHYGLSAEGTSPDNLKILVESEALQGVQIDLKVELDSDGENNIYYFMPVITLPTLDSTELDYADSIHYYLKEYTDNIGRFAKYIMGVPFTEGMYNDYFEELDYEE